VKLRSWPEIGSDGDVLLTPYVPEGDNRKWWWCGGKALVNLISTLISS